MLDTAVCRGCKEELPLSAFYRNAREKNGVQRYCRKCQNQLNAASRTKRVNREREELAPPTEGIPLVWQFLKNECGITPEKRFRDPWHTDQEIVRLFTEWWMAWAGLEITPVFGDTPAHIVAIDKMPRHKNEDLYCWLSRYVTWLMMEVAGRARCSRFVAR